MTFPVFFDTCALFSAVFTDAALTLAEQGIFAPYWSPPVLDAVERNVVARGLAPRSAIQHRLEQMNQAFPQATVTGFEDLIPVMTNHPGDRHVLAACIVSPARTLVTFNLKDFPASSLREHEIEAVHPDHFLVDQLDLYPERSRTALERMLRRNSRPPQDWPMLCQHLLRSGLPESAGLIRTWS